MLSSFAGLNLGMRALSAFSLGMQTVGNNIANIDTEGYSRQKVVYGTSTPLDLPGVGQVGQGVEVESIMRIRNEFLDYQYRMNAAAGGYWDKLDSIYAAIEKYFPEPLNDGISAQITTFFSAVQTLQQKPEDTAARAALVGSAETLSGMLSTLNEQFDSLSDTLNQQILSGVDEVNGILHEIASLNYMIFEAEALDQNANSLRDQRDLLLDQLSGLIDVSYTDANNEFWVTLNGRTLVQGNFVRELAAHPFQWNGKTYYDVQVTDNEFNIVSNPCIADILATGPEGTYQLIVDRVANGEEWTVGGDNATCLDTTSVSTADFKDGKILTDSSDKFTRKLEIRSTDNNTGLAVQLTVSIAWNENDKKWDLTATDLSGETLGTKAVSATSDLTVEDIAKYINNIVQSEEDFKNSGIVAKANKNEIKDDKGTVIRTDYSLMIKAEVQKVDADGNPVVDADGNAVMVAKSMEVTDYSGMLGTLSKVTTPRKNSDGSLVMMRVHPADTDEALGLTGSFRIQVGAQGTRVTSKNFVFDNVNNFAVGQVLGAGTAGETYTFRIGSGIEQTDITVAWNNSTGNWVLSSDRSLTSINCGDKLMLKDIADFLNSDAGLAKTDLKVVYGDNNSGAQFYIESSASHLISITDITGNLAERLGMANDDPIITINVESTDSLETIRNKINEKYQAELGLTEPEQWVHASIKQASDQSYYLTISADVAGEAQRITLMGAEDGNMQVLRRLGFTSNVPVNYTYTDANGKEQIGEFYREVTAIATASQDAAFLFNGVRYMSSDNMFNTARRIPVSGTSDYSASTLSEVQEGMWFNLKNEGITTITVKHHVRDGALKAIEDARDKVIPNMKGTLDGLAYELVTHFNAYQYSGYGIGNELNTTGSAFFEPLNTKAGASERISVSSAVQTNHALIAAAMGKKDATTGIASFGVSSGSGDGTNATRLAMLGSELIMNSGSSSLVNFYNGLLSEIGSDSSYASLMNTANQNILDQINAERDSVSGVNLDEELVDIVILNRCWGAMARYVTAIDEMLNTLINGFGVVGR